MFACDRGFQLKIVESDSLLLVNAINSSSASVVIYSIANDIKTLLPSMSDGSCHYIPLVRESITLGQDVIWMYDCPRCISYCILHDAHHN